MNRARYRQMARLMSRLLAAPRNEFDDALLGLATGDLVDIVATPEYEAMSREQVDSLVLVLSSRAEEMLVEGE
jgi:hypothetical protein